MESFTIKRGYSQKFWNQRDLGRNLGYCSAPSKHVVSITSVLLPSDVSPLWKLHRDVKLFATVFVREKLRIITRGFAVSVGDELPSNREFTLADISRMEQLRIFRSICRSAIFGDLYFQDKKMLEEGLEPDAELQSDSFLSYFLRGKSRN